MSDEDAVYRWRVLRRAEWLPGTTNPPVDYQGETYWQEMGSLGTKYGAPEADEIGALGGAGEYLLIRRGADNYHVAQFEIEGRTAYSKVEPPGIPAPESLRVEGPA